MKSIFTACSTIHIVRDDYLESTLIRIRGHAELQNNLSHSLVNPRPPNFPSNRRLVETPDPVHPAGFQLTREADAGEDAIKFRGCRQ